MEKINEKPKKIVFSHEMENSLINAIRRYVFKIPSLAIDEVEISKNDSSLYDETVAHRLGLIPFASKKKSGKIELETKKQGFIYAEQIKGDAEAVYGKMPITFLEKDQELKISAELKSDLGEKHSKYLPGTIFFRNASKISLDKKYLDEIQKGVPEDQIENKKDSLIIYDNKEKEIADFCEGVAKKQGDSPEIVDTGEKIICIESFGQMNPKDIWKESIKNLRKDLEAVSKKIK